VTHFNLEISYYIQMDIILCWSSNVQTHLIRVNIDTALGKIKSAFRKMYCKNLLLILKLHY